MSTQKLVYMFVTTLFLRAKRWEQTQVFNGEHEFSMPTNWGTKSSHERMKH